MEPKPTKTIIISQNKYPAINYSWQRPLTERQKTIVSHRAGRPGVNTGYLMLRQVWV